MGQHSTRPLPKSQRKKREKLETLAKNETTSPVVHRHLLCSSYPRCCQFACGLFFSSHLSATQRRGGSAHALPLAGGKKGANERSHYVGPEFPFFLSLCLAYNGTHREWATQNVNDVITDIYLSYCTPSVCPSILGFFLIHPHTLANVFPHPVWLVWWSFERGDHPNCTIHFLFLLFSIEERRFHLLHHPIFLSFCGWSVCLFHSLFLLWCHKGPSRTKSGP